MDHPPLEFLQKMERLLGNEYNAFSACYAFSAQNGLRVNTIKCSVDKFLELAKYSLSGIATLNLSQLSWCPSGFAFSVTDLSSGSDYQLGKNPFHSAGIYYLQDPSAMAVAEILAPQPGERVLDIAAAPGGKTTHLASLMCNKGFLVANEIHPRRVWDLAQNVERCGIINTVITNETPERLAKHFGPFFDRVLVDAPCSGEGMFRKSSDAVGAWSTRTVLRCADRQLGILLDAAQLIKPGGYLCYATCTFSPEENEQIIARFLDHQTLADNPFELVHIAENPAFQPGKTDWLLPSTSEPHPVERTVRMWPHHGAPEGHFIALMQRAYDQTIPQLPTSIKSIHPQIYKTIAEFTKNFLKVDFPQSRLSFHGSYVYLLPEGIPELSGLKVIHPGWWLGSIRNHRFTPSHALAMGLTTGQAIQVEKFNLIDDLLRAYLRGESLSIPGENGFILIALSVPEASLAFPIGWGKRSQNILKNNLPKGLRW